MRLDRRRADVQNGLAGTARHLTGIGVHVALVGYVVLALATAAAERIALQRDSAPT